MNVRALSDWKAIRLARVLDPTGDAPPAGPIHSGFTRRRFARTAFGAGAAIGLSSRLWNPRLAKGAGSFTPVPIPGGSPFVGGYHVFGPAAFDPIDAEPATITNMDGNVGLAYVSGMVTQTNTRTGQTMRLAFNDSDMRFMQGVFRDADGRVHQGAFAFV
jgi:hypothetical protein